MTDTPALDSFIIGESAKLKQVHAANILAKYGPLKSHIEVLHKRLTMSSTLADIGDSARDQLDPGWKLFSMTKVNLPDLSFFKFLKKITGSLIIHVDNSTKRSAQMGIYTSTLLPVLLQHDVDLAQIIEAEGAGAMLIQAAHEEFRETVLGFEKLLAEIYIATRTEYKRLRRKYLGEKSKLDSKADELEDNILSQFFGNAPKPPDEPLGPATALVEDNCVLTQLLTDLSDALPKRYERIAPILKGGVATGKTKTTKQLDEGEVEEYAQLIVDAAHPSYMNYVYDPAALLRNVLSVLTQFHLVYAHIEIPLRALVEKTAAGGQLRGVKAILPPQAIARQYSRINFLAIRPAAEDVAPRTRVERDYAVARTKLLDHLLETYQKLSGMNRMDDATEAYAVMRTKEAIELRERMDEVTQTQHQKSLAQNIRDENEFYISKNGMHGALQAEREAAPSITYKDVVGESFARAKAHVEEVVTVASHTNIMRLSAPRGDLKSNLLLIGSYGCGKSLLAKAIGSDKRIIGFSVAGADLLTAYMHESVKNIKRMFDLARDLRRGSRETKPVALILDEFDRLFSFGEGVNQAYDGPRMEGTLQEMMDGVVGYEGVFIVALTNIPKAVPEAILRRFKYVDVVGQLTKEERAKLFESFLVRGLPIDPSIGEKEYLIWAQMLDHAPGDVIGKVADEVHFKFMHEYMEAHPDRAGKIERALAKRLKDREITPGDRTYLKRSLGSFKNLLPEEITAALDNVLRQPQVQMQITKAKETYRDAEDILRGLSHVGDKGLGFGAGRKSDLWTR